MKMYYLSHDVDGLRLCCHEGNVGSIELSGCFASKKAALSAYRDYLSATLAEHRQTVADIGRKADELNELIFSEHRKVDNEMLNDKQRKKMLADEDERVERCNFQVGDIVDYHSIIGREITSSGHTIKVIAPMHGGGADMAWITGKAGCVCLAALTPTKGHDNALR